MTDVHITPHPNPLPDVERRAILAAPVFGETFTDHMVTMAYRDGTWGPMELQPFAPIPLSPATLALHYGQSIFEALKAYAHPDGTAALFRPGLNAERMAASARRIAMPELPDGAFELGCALLADADKAWVPTSEGAALYIRPFMFASEPHLSVRPANEYLFVIIASPVASYFGQHLDAITVAVEASDVRAAAGGTGAVKFAGNYAAGFGAHGRAGTSGCDQVLWLDAVEHRWVEELNAMNVMFVWDRDGKTVLTTPPLTGTILGGVTRESILALAADLAAGRAPTKGPTVDEVLEEPTSIEQIRAGVANRSLLEMFACGTAAVVAPIGTAREGTGSSTIGSGAPGQVTVALRRLLLDIQQGRAADLHGWMVPVSDMVAQSRPTLR